jgi:hypothetical protein
MDLDEVRQFTVHARDICVAPTTIVAMNGDSCDVSEGMACAFTRCSSDYIGQEKAAIGARLGVHAHDC